jgi:hypothetical protein
MKKQLLALLCVMLFGATKVWADSGLYLFGIEVPSTVDWTCTTKDFLNLDGGLLNGTISYDAETKTMTFDYVQAVVYDDTRILYNKNVPDLKIVFNNWATLISSYCVFRLDKDTEIQGPASDNNLVQFEARGNNSQCIYCPNETKLTIRDFGKLKMTSKYRAIHTKGTKVSIYNSNIYAQGDDCAMQNDEAYFGITHDAAGYLALKGCLLRDPWGNYFGSVGEGYTTTEVGITQFHVHTSKAKSFMIIRNEDYIGVRLKGIALTKGWSINEDTSNPSYGIEDYYTYDESTKTLTLKKDFRAKTGYNSELCKNLEDWIGIIISNPITINGDGHYVYGQRGLSCHDYATLNNIIVAGTEDGIYVAYESKLTLKDDIIIGGGESAIEFYKDYNGISKGTVIFNPSFGKTVTLVPCNNNFQEKTSFDDYPIDGYGAKLESCIITTPEGAEMRAGGPVLNGKLVKTKVVFTGIETYDLLVGETQVTSANASDILGDGQFKYNASTKTLTVTNATLENTNGNGIYNEGIDGLTVNFVGTNTFNTYLSSIYSEKDITLAGNGSLKATSSSTYGIYLSSDLTCTINGPQLDLTTSKESIYDNGNSTLNVMGSSTRLALHPGNNRKAIKYLKALNIGNGLHISQPEGGYFKYWLDITVDGTNEYVGDVVIENEQNRKLGFSINGDEMTTSNMNNIYGVVSGDAYITLDSDNNPILVLNNATLDWNDADAALYLKWGTELTINVQGDCVINAPDHTGLDLSGNTTITGGGTLRINSKWAAITNWEDTRFTLQNNTTLIAHSSDYYGYCDEGYDYDQQKSWFIIKDGGHFAAFGKYGPISFSNDRMVNFDSYTEVRYPIGGQLGNNYVYDADGNEVTNDWVVIGPDTQATDELIEELIYFPRRELGFAINGKEMTGSDVNDVPGVVSGNAYIDASETNASTLVLDNATLNWNDASDALNLHMGKNLTIRVLGDCQVNAIDHTGFSISGNAIIEGGGTLRINSKWEGFETFDNARLTIRGNTKVIAQSSNYYGYNDSGREDGAYCSIENGSVFAAFGAGPYNPFSFGYRSAHLGNGIDVRYPVGGYLSGMYVYYANYSEVINDWVVFGPDNEATNELIEELVKNEHKLGFAINGKEMTTANMDNVPGLVSGNAYIETSGTGAPTLVLEGATLEWNEATDGLYNYNVGQNSLTIRVLGICRIKVPNAVALDLDVETLTTIEGGGSLNIISGSYPIEIWNTSTLIIQDGTTVLAQAETPYSALWNHNGAELLIRDGGTFAAYGTYEPIYLDPNSSFVLGEGIALRYPVDAYFGSRNKIYYADGSEVIDDWVIFGPANQATQDLIDGVSPLGETEEGVAIYNLSGHRLNKMQKGINIIRYSDGTSRKVLIK